MTSPTSPILLKKTEVCERLSLSARSLEGMVKAGTFPPAVRMGKHVCPDLMNSHTQIGGDHLGNKRDEIETKSL